MSASYWQEFLSSSKTVLLLQGPIGPYFYQLNQFLCEQGKDVYKLNFNGGDSFYYPHNACTYVYNDSLENFQRYLSDFIEKYQIDTIVCFGHKRAYHVIAKQLCLENSQDISFWSFEEGYLRPYYITFEKWGVNNASILPRDANFYLNQISEVPELRQPQPVTASFSSRAWLATHYYMSMHFHKDYYSKYVHHRERRIWNYIGAWCTSAWRKWAYRPYESSLAKNIEGSHFPEFFIVPLQVHNDSQVKDFSISKNIPAFIRHVLRSFSKCADEKYHIVLKHHPMDRGFNHYGALIKKLIKQYKLEGRVHYVFDVPMPIFLRKAKGMVVINSTSGLSALIHGLPTKVLGKAPYDFEGLTDQQSLSLFWNNPQPPNAKVFNAYKTYLLYKTQLNDCFYSRNDVLHFDQIDLSNYSQNHNISSQEM